YEMSFSLGFLNLILSVELIIFNMLIVESFDNSALEKGPKTVSIENMNKITNPITK
ncbi:hypothetical protein HK099_004375, partial [Clydaea vesicula]